MSEGTSAAPPAAETEVKTEKVVVPAAAVVRMAEEMAGPLCRAA